jgi:thioredoxin-related protein
MAGECKEMTTRRDMLVGAGALALSASVARPARAEGPILTDDGLYRESWFIESFLDLADDLGDAHKQGKRLVLMWELKGCPYCRETHFVNFARPDIAEFVKANFDVLLVNIIGSRVVTDFDGAELSEKQLAGKYGVRYTPTLQFFPETIAGLKSRAPDQREVSRIAGYLKPDDFIAMFRYVRSKAYESKSFRDFLKSTPS